MLAGLQTIYHLQYDYDRVFTPITNLGSTSTSNQRPYILESPMTHLKATTPSKLISIGTRSVVLGLFGGPAIYGIFIRKAAWSWSLYFARIIWDIPATGELSYVPSYHISLLFRAVCYALLLSLLFEASNVSFTAYVSQEPLKQDKPLTKDNSSLLNGLKSKREVTKVHLIDLSLPIVADHTRPLPFGSLFA